MRIILLLIVGSAAFAQGNRTAALAKDAVDVLQGLYNIYDTYEKPSVACPTKVAINYNSNALVLIQTYNPTIGNMIPNPMRLPLTPGVDSNVAQNGNFPVDLYRKDSVLGYSGGAEASGELRQNGGYPFIDRKEEVLFNDADRSVLKSSNSYRNIGRAYRIASIQSQPGALIRLTLIAGYEAVAETLDGGEVKQLDCIFRKQ